MADCGWATVGHANRWDAAAFLVSEGMISNESPVWETRILGPMSGERKHGRSGDSGTGTKAKAIGNSYSPDPRQAHLSSTLPLFSLSLTCLNLSLSLLAMANMESISFQ